MKKLIERRIRKVIALLKTDTEQNKQGRELMTDIQEAEFWELYDFCSPYTMTSIERMYSLYQSVKYIIANDVKGDFIECGVWKGGSAMLIAKYLAVHGIANRKVILYDTFEGMSEPTEADKDYRGEDAQKQLNDSNKTDKSLIWAYSSFDAVKANMEKTGLSSDLVYMIQGKVEDTIPANVPTDAIALLRLDTDWYESTLHELKFLYPLLVERGVLIIDDFGHWQGCRKAVEEYFAAENIKVLLNRIDVTGRLAIKM